LFFSVYCENIIIFCGKYTSQQVTFPLFLFTKIIYCNQDWSNKPCPDITSSIGQVWMLIYWPFYVVGTGLLVGKLVTIVCRTPLSQRNAVYTSCGFANSTGLPITLLAVVHANFPDTSDLGRIDPTLFLSIYLLLYPVLQWGLGGWLLAPETENEKVTASIRSAATTVDATTSSDKLSDIKRRNNETGTRIDINGNEAIATELSPLIHVGYTDSVDPSSQLVDIEGDDNECTLDHPHDPHCRHYRHVLNNRLSQRKLVSSDEGLYISEVNLLALNNNDNEEEAGDPVFVQSNLSMTSPVLRTGSERMKSDPMTVKIMSDRSVILPLQLRTSFKVSESSQRSTQENNIKTSDIRFEVDSLLEVLRNIGERCFQPPVVGALTGLVCAAITPLRGIFVDLESRRGRAPMQWCFDALYEVGNTAVPINMIILGCNLSASFAGNDSLKKPGSPENISNIANHGLLSTATMIGIVVGKMIIHPIIGIMSAIILRRYFWNIPEDLDGSFYLMLQVVFLTPTANNVMVMVELSGSRFKEGIARVIALQYAVAPIILSLTMTVAIGVASRWS
jgi:predicted permease